MAAKPNSSIPSTTKSVVFVCLGNICRSPTADGVFRKMVGDAGLTDSILVDSAGTGAWHVGESPDKRATQAAKRRGYDLSPLRARQFQAKDFDRFDYVLAMDYSNLQDLRALCPSHADEKLKLFLSFSENFSEEEVPDPYYGGATGFDHVLDLVEDACKFLLREMSARLT